MDAIANFAYTTVTVAPSPATTGLSLTIKDPGLMPAVPFNAVVWPTGVAALAANAEIVRVTNNAAGVLTIERKAESSTARAIVVGDQFAQTATKKVFDDLAATAASALKEEALTGSGTIKLDLSKATVFRVELTGNALFTFINAPTHPVEVDLVVTQDATGGRTWSVENAEWVGSEPTFSTAAKAAAWVGLLLTASAGKVLAFGGSGGGGGGFSGTNTYVGLNVAPGNTTGTENTAVGDKGMAANTEGKRNTAVGYEALTAVTTGPENTAVGWRALIANTTGYKNTAVGLEAMSANTTGGENVAIGSQALAANKTGIGNVAVGQHALQLATGSEATAVGYGALASTTSSNVTAVGSQALTALTTGTANSAVGHNALATSKTGSNNTAMGAGALRNSTASGCTAFGQAALEALTTGESNTAVGRSALGLSTTGEQNVAVGYQAGGTNLTGSGNVFIGYEAGQKELGSNKLYIANSNTTTPLILGDFSAKELTLVPTGGKLGLFGVAPVARPTVNKGSTVDELNTALKSLGVIAGT